MRNTWHSEARGDSSVRDGEDSAGGRNPCLGSGCVVVSLAGVTRVGLAGGSLALMALATCVIGCAQQCGDGVAGAKTGWGSVEPKGWIVEPRDIIQQMSALRKQLKPYDPVCQTEPSWEELEEPENAKRAQDAGEALGIGIECDKLLWRIWRLTGTPPVLRDKSVGGLPENIEANMAGYRALIIRGHKKPREEIIRNGLSDTIQLLKTKHWRCALLCLSEVLGLHVYRVRTRPRHRGALLGIGRREGPLPRQEASKLIRAFHEYLRTNSGKMKWNEREMSFSCSDVSSIGAAVSDAMVSSFGLAPGHN